jgi:FkbM family methyltransferase
VRVLPAERERAGVRVADQRRRLEQYVTDRGWELAEVLEDIGADARPRNQHALKRLLADPAGVDKLVVLRIDRFGRQLRHTLEVIQQLQNGGVDLVSVEEDFDTGADTGRVVPALFRHLAEWEWWSKEVWSDGWRPENLRKPGLSPATLIDVGVAMGTPALYRAFPDAHLVLIEPLVEYEQDLARLVRETGGEYLLTAVGAHEGTVTIDVDHSNPILSSILELGERSAETAAQTERRQIPVTTLDALLEQHRWSPPFALKIDTEGYEREVVLGAKELLRKTQFVIAEVTVTKRFEGSYTFAEFIALMDSHGFHLCDILDGQRWWARREAAFIDAMFRRTD